MERENAVKCVQSAFFMVRFGIHKLIIMVDFKSFIEAENKKEKQKKVNFDPEERISLFRNRVNELYALIDDDWLKAYIENDEIKTSYRDIQITEELLGSYPVREKIIEIGRHIFILRPIGTILIGTPGRVDLLYQSRKVMFVLVGENVKSPRMQITIKINGEIEGRGKEKDPGRLVWKYTQRDGVMTYHDLSADSFQKLLMNLTDGKDQF